MSIPSSDSSAPGNVGTVEQADIRGLKSLEAFHYPPMYYVGGALLLLALLGLLVWGIYRLIKRRSKPTLPPLPPEPLDVVILRRLNNLGRDLATMPLRRGYFEVSEIFRDYLEGRFSFPASDWTTEEIFSYAKKFLFPALMEEILPLLTVADEVKFAGRMPKTDQLLSLIRQAEEFVRRTT